MTKAKVSPENHWVKAKVSMGTTQGFSRPNPRFHWGPHIKSPLHLNPHHQRAARLRLRPRRADTSKTRCPGLASICPSRAARHARQAITGCACGPGAPAHAATQAGSREGKPGDESTQDHALSAMP